MIFVTVGTQLPFDRLVNAVDQWAGTEKSKEAVFAQIGPAKATPEFIEWERFIDTQEFRKRVENARIIVAHAGMGSIITALELAKPIIVMPRRADLGEHRNDHQIATAKYFSEKGTISVVNNTSELSKALNRADHLETGRSISTEAEPELIDALRQFIRG